jgi:hypothetical protein
MAVFMKAVITHLVVDPQKNQHGRCHAYCQTGDIDERETLAAPKISECNFQIILKHMQLATNEVPIAYGFMNQ